MLRVETCCTGRFIRRINRFMGLAVVGGVEAPVHIHDSGRLAELLVEGARIWVRRGRGKAPYYLVAVEAWDGPVLLDTAMHGPMFQAVVSRIFPGRRVARREVPLGRGRVDFLLDDGTYVEVKGVSLLRDGTALFPDAPTARGRRHVEELTRVASQGGKAAVVFLVVRCGAREFAPNAEVDPAFARSVATAVRHGVRVVAIKMCLGRDMELRTCGEVPLRLSALS